MHPLVEYVERVDVWAASIEDKPGGLAQALAALRDAGADLQLVMEWRVCVMLKPTCAAAAISLSPWSGVTNTTPLPGSARRETFESWALIGRASPRS